ncbi:MAG: hypothetical protein HYZ93_00860, partial [Candidatus Omnitrophica bacterium]|nr:hypothetical protein [Candidatus Omnitrophota bacterium]
MESLLLISAQKSVLKQMKAHLVRGGFQVTALEIAEMDRLEGSKERFRLGILDASSEGRLSLLVDQLRTSPGAKELPLLVILNEGHLKELSVVAGLEDFLIAPADP